MGSALSDMMASPVVAGNPPERRIEALAAFWDDAAAPVGPSLIRWGAAGGTVELAERRAEPIA